MSTQSPLTPALREAILARPEDILDDRDMMQALIANNEKRMGANIVDLRGIAMERLEARLDRLENTHASVIAAAYDNLAGTKQVHRAVLRLLEAKELGDFLGALREEVAEVLRVDTIRLVLEVNGSPLSKADGHGVLCVTAPGFIHGYLSQTRSGEPRDILLRPAPPARETLFGKAGQRLGSEACVRLDFDTEGVIGLLALGARNPEQFSAQQGTDLLAFFGGVVERQVRRWLP